jgi:hypothetical protein
MRRPRPVALAVEPLIVVLADDVHSTTTLTAATGSIKVIVYEAVLTRSMMTEAAPMLKT